MSGSRMDGKSRCTSRYDGIQGIVRCSKKAGHEQFKHSQLHINEKPGFHQSWTDEQALKEDAA